MDKMNLISSRRTNRLLPKPNYRLGDTKYNTGYCRQCYCRTGNMTVLIPKLGFSGLDYVNATIKLNRNYMEFLGYTNVL